MAKVVQAGAGSVTSRSTEPTKSASRPGGVPASHSHHDPNGSPGRGVARAQAQTRDSDTAVKHFVLDTNVLLHNPDAVFVFKEHHVVIPFAVIEELDKMKRKDDDLGRNARACIRHLDRLRMVGHLNEGVDWGLLGAMANTAVSTGPGGATGSVTIEINEFARRPSIAEEALE